MTITGRTRMVSYMKNEDEGSESSITTVVDADELDITVHASTQLSNNTNTHHTLDHTITDLRRTISFNQAGKDAHMFACLQ